MVGVDAWTAATRVYWRVKPAAGSNCASAPAAAAACQSPPSELLAASQSHNITLQRADAAAASGLPTVGASKESDELVEVGFEFRKLRFLYHPETNTFTRLKCVRQRVGGLAWVRWQLPR